MYPMIWRANLVIIFWDMKCFLVISKSLLSIFISNLFSFNKIVKKVELFSK
ncbi:hypothetical protein EDB39_1011074 [Vibrio crassostreae]|nr:hypothetical protein EDB52_101130 [Vibrio crassostreae]TCT53998.1 hypothetical protein EDB39_1011074 [Vibrio crassostreae]TCT62462.1 hypothetical protein EDB40_102519 [Vibrio crassostreae]